MLAKAMKARRHRSICLIDLAVPRNVDPACADLADVYAYDVDDLQKVVESTHEARQGEALRAEAIVEAEVMAFARERETRAALPVLAQLRRRAEAIARAEAERTLSQVGAKLDDKGAQVRRGDGAGHREQAAPRPHRAPEGGRVLGRRRRPRRAPPRSSSASRPARPAGRPDARPRRAARTQPPAPSARRVPGAPDAPLQRTESPETTERHRDHDPHRDPPQPARQVAGEPRRRPAPRAASPGSTSACTSS